MPVNAHALEEQLLETPAGRAVFDALVQANIDINTVSRDRVKEMLIQECRVLSRHLRLDEAALSVTC